ncbi:MAG TPA: hypothetical protein VEH84_07180 [Alphaproteobacteria bacterium]|nr:hypothetical protein [Alphaproteobacteria bacterium]
MMKPPIWIVKDKVNFRDIISDENKYVTAWFDIVKHLLIEPARRLADPEKVTDRGIALLTLELSFFEPFGSIITGESSEGASQRTFSIGLKEFAEWAKTKGFIGDKELEILSVIGTGSNPNVLYSFGRCGLMHSMTMKGGFVFIDAVQTGKYSITDLRYNIAYKNGNNIAETDSILLVDPWRLLNQIEMFVEDFQSKLRQTPRSDVQYINFKKTFERSFVDPGKAYFGVQGS